MGAAHDADMTPGDLLKALRTQHHLTQRQVGNALGGITDSAVSEWERNLSKPGYHSTAALDTLLEANGQILDAFGFTPPGASALDELRAQVAQQGAAIARLEALVAQLLEQPGQPTDPAEHAGRPARQRSK